MIKISGMLLIIISTSMAGIWCASGLTKRVSTLENTIRLYQYLHDRLKYMQPSIATLISGAASSGEFQSLGFLQSCCSRMQSGDSFAESWKTAVANDTAAVGKDAGAILQSLSGVLGTTDLESQISAISYGKAMLESRLEDAREYAARHQKMYRTLGVLAGGAIVVFIA